MKVELCALLERWQRPLRPCSRWIRFSLVSLAVWVVGWSSPLQAAVPQISSFTPSSGPAGTQVTIQGGDLAGATDVQFGGISAQFTVFGGQQILAIVPTGANSGAITVLTPDGNASSSQSFTVTQQPPPTLTNFTPTSGAVGTQVTLNGANLGGAASVTFNGVAATFSAGFSGTNLVAFVPVGASTGPITVVTPAGSVSSSVVFTVLAAAAPRITDVSPASGPEGSSITISGDHLSAPSQVLFGGVSATSFTFFGNIISTTVPVGAKSGVITVVTPGGTATSPVVFTVTPPGAPNITSVTPGRGGPGTSVAITGDNLDKTTSVVFNGVAADFQQFGPSVIATVPTNATTGVITIVTDKGTAMSPTPFVVAGPLSPDITSFTPSSGGPGTVVSITGTNLNGATQVSFGGVSANFVALSNTNISALLPAGAVNGFIQLQTPNGTAVSPSQFLVLPTVTSFAPDHGAPRTSVTIHGANLDGTLTVLFGGAAATYTNVSPTEVRAVVPDAAVSGVISVATAAGFGTSSNNFFVPPQITSFSPLSGLPGTVVTINGQNLLETTAVAFGGVPAVSITPVSATTLEAIVPAGAVGGPITVTAPGGTATSAELFAIGIRSDLAVGVSASPDSVSIGDFLRYTVTATNIGPADATNVVVFELLPDGVTLVFPPSGVDWSRTNSLVTLRLGTIVGGATVSVPLTTSVTQGPYLTNQVSITAAGIDPDPNNNSATLITALAGVPPPPKDVSVQFGVNGSSLTLAWPAAAIGYVLESTVSLVPPVTWTAVDGAPTVLNGTNTVTQSTSTGRRFYRLHGP